MTLPSRESSNNCILKVRLAGLLRTRVILSMVGLYAMYKQPAIGPWVLGVVGMALGVSAVDAWKGEQGGRSERSKGSDGIDTGDSKGN